MGAVYNGGFPIECMQAGALLYGSDMVLILTAVLVEGGGGKMLGDSAAEGYVYDLHPFADAKNRNASADGVIQGLKLKDIKLCVNLPGTTVVLPEKGRCDIAASRKQQSLTGGYFSGI